MTALALALLVVTGPVDAGAVVPLEKLRLEMQARADGKDTVFHMWGWVYGFIPGERPQRLFGLEGFNIRRRIETPEKDGYFVASRELVFYSDPKTGQLLREWDNPYTKERNEVFPIANDPVNFRMRLKEGKYVSVSLDGSREFGPSEPAQDLGDYWAFTADIFPFYPMPGWEKSYTAGEMFDFYVPKAGPDKTGALPVMNSWTRIGPWLPWMKMDGHEGLLIYHARSRRYESFDALPATLKERVKGPYEVYRTAPTSVDPKKPNVTSWTTYREEMERRKAASPPPSPPPQ